LREFKATFSTTVYELELKYGAYYNEAFTFKQLAQVWSLLHRGIHIQTTSS
jgi:hypothetical protein